MGRLKNIVKTIKLKIMKLKTIKLKTTKLKTISILFWLSLGLWTMFTLIVKPNWDKVGYAPERLIPGLIIILVAWVGFFAVVAYKSWHAMINTKLVVSWMILCSVLFGVFIARVCDRLDRNILNYVTLVSTSVVFVLFLVDIVKLWRGK
jgi:hypothetical protein